MNSNITNEKNFDLENKIEAHKKMLNNHEARIKTLEEHAKEIATHNEMLYNHEILIQTIIDAHQKMLDNHEGK